MEEIKFSGRIERGSSNSAGYDLFAAEDVTIQPQLTAVVDVGLTWEVQPGFRVFGMIKDRSSLAARGLRVGAGIVDPDYRGPIKVVLQNCNFHAWKIDAGTRIAQFIVLPFFDLGEKYEVERIRGTGGFGSTGD